LELFLDCSLTFFCPKTSFPPLIFFFFLDTVPPFFALAAHEFPCSPFDGFFVYYVLLFFPSSFVNVRPPHCIPTAATNPQWSPFFLEAEVFLFFPSCFFFFRQRFAISGPGASSTLVLHIPHDPPSAPLPLFSCLSNPFFL